MITIALWVEFFSGGWSTETAGFAFLEHGRGVEYLAGIMDEFEFSFISQQGAVDEYLIEHIPAVKIMAAAAIAVLGSDSIDLSFSKTCQ